MDDDASLKRVLTALDLKAPDKIPFHAYESPDHAIRQSGYKVHEMYLQPELLPRAMIATAKKYANDIVYVRCGFFLPDTQRIAQTDNALVFYDKKTDEMLGHVLYDTRSFIPAKPKAPIIQSAKDIDKMEILSCEEIIQQPEWQSSKPYIEEFKGKRFLFAFACAPSANVLDECLGTENAMVAASTDKSLCREIMERRYEQNTQFILALKTLGFDGLYTGDACASCSFFSPRLYRELFFEYQKRTIEFAHTQGLKALLHICGKISPILEDMADTGADVIESLDAYSAGGDIDLKDAKKRVGTRVCLKGNIDAVHVIEPLEPEAIYSKCMQAMRDAGPAGYILSTEQITRDTPAEHVLAMLQARDDYSAGHLQDKNPL